MATLTPEPTYPAPNRPVRITFGLTESGTNYVRVWCTDAPSGTTLRQELSKSTQSRVKVYEGDGGSAWANGVFERGGAYRFVAQEYTRGAESHGGEYEGDPAAAPLETKVGSEATLILYIGQRMTLPLGFGADTATLVLFVWNDTIRGTTISVHGEETPAMLNPSSPRAASAVATTSVKDAVDDLKGVAVATAIGNVGTIVADIIDNYEAHRTQASVHAANDTDNTIAAAYRQAPTPQTLPGIVSEALSKLRRHMANDASGGPASAAYHVVSTENRADWTNLPLFPSGSDLAGSYAAIADLWRAYEAHRVSTTVHTSADSTNTLAALPALLVVHREFLEALASLSPTVPPTQSSGAVLLMSQAGAIET